MEIWPAHRQEPLQFQCQLSTWKELLDNGQGVLKADRNQNGKPKPQPKPKTKPKPMHLGRSLRLWVEKHQEPLLLLRCDVLQLCVAPLAVFS